MAKEVQGETVNLREKIEVKGIKHKDPAKQKYVVGKVYRVHPDTAENLVETGHAEYVDKKVKK